MSVEPRSDVVLDCRWLGNGGPGRVTELLLRGLAERPPPGRWALWGPPATKAFAWPGAAFAPTSVDPRALLGQRSALQVPDGRLTVFMHQQRPLRNVPSVTVVLDTIPLRHGANPAARSLKKCFLRRVGTISARIVTISEHSRTCIVDDLGVPPERIDVVRLPFDDELVSRVATLRDGGPQLDVVVYIGNFLPHKNLPRLLASFEATRFHHQGGKLVLAGGSGDQVRRLRRGLSLAQQGFVEIRPVCDQAEIDRLLATSLLLVQPSLEEGFGLPTWEALCCGLPVCVSDGGALPEVVGDLAEPFPAQSVEAMTSALDQGVADARSTRPGQTAGVIRRLREKSPGLEEFGEQFQAIIDRELSTRR